MKHIVGLSGGKDSTAMALRLTEIEPRDYTYICTPTGNEPREMTEHWANLECLLGRPIIHLGAFGQTLESLIEAQNCLPSNLIRWCTRRLKIEPTIAYFQANAPAVLYVGLRADEEDRQGIYGDIVVSDFPFRRWGWTEDDVWDYLHRRGGTIPAEQPKPAAVPLPQPVVMPPQVKRKSPDTGSRPLSPDEKQAIKKDWNSLGEHLRTKENRIALARKYQCSPVQIFALNRLPGHYRKMTARRNEIRSQAQPQTA